MPPNSTVMKMESKGHVRRVYERARSIVVLRDEDGAEIEQKASGSETPI